MEEDGQHSLVQELRGHEGPVWQVAWAHPSFGSMLASCSHDHRVIIWKETAAGELSTSPRVMIARLYALRSCSDLRSVNTRDIHQCCESVRATLHNITRSLRTGHLPPLRRAQSCEQTTLVSHTHSHKYRIDSCVAGWEKFKVYGTTPEEAASSGAPHPWRWSRTVEVLMQGSFVSTISR